MTPKKNPMKNKTQSTIKSETNCPICGGGVTVEGDDREGTHYYVPIDFKSQLSEAREKLKQAHKWEELEAADYQKKLAEAQREIEKQKKIADDFGEAWIKAKTRLSAAERLLEDAELHINGNPDNWHGDYAAYKASNNKQEKAE